MTDPAERQRSQFQAVWVEHHSFLFDYARRRGLNDDQAEEAVSEAFGNAWLHRKNFPLGVGARAALTRATFHAVSNQTRRERRERGLLGRLKRERLDEPTVYPASHLDAQERLASAMRQLSMQDQELLRLANWERFDQAQIAVVMDMTPGNVAVRLHRARKQLRLLLEKSQQESSTPVVDQRGEAAHGSEG